MERENKGLRNNKMQGNMKDKKNSIKTAKSAKGITLVALVITIVILIILAVVAINAVFGDSGLLKYAQDAKNYQANADTSDAEMINDATSYIDGIISGNEGSGGTPDEPTEPSRISDIKPDTEDDIDYFDKTTEVKDDSGDSVWVPGGFGITEDSATDADNGVVIQDEKGNEFVWIPVPDYTTMYTETPGTKLSGEDVGVTTTTDVYSKLRQRADDTYTVTTPGSSGSNDIREPDIVTNYDTQEKYYKDILGYDSPKDMADAMVAEYTATYNSIKKYHGFYIGRYELTGSVAEPTVKKGQTVLTADIASNWYNLKKACSNVVSSEYAQSEMIYGNQWDEIMSWLKETVFKNDTDKVDVDSSSWGNYNSASGGTGMQQASGSNEVWKANNIYDLAGNCWEWTQEAIITGYRVTRGGYYNDDGSLVPSSDRYYNYSGNSDSAGSSRPALYIK